MNGNLVKSILGLTITAVVIGGIIVGVNIYHNNKGIATGAGEEIAFEDIREEDEAVNEEEALTDADLELLSLEKEESEDAENAEATEEAETDEKEEETEEVKTEETDKKETAKTDSNKKTETTEEVATTATTQTTTETTSAPTETVTQQTTEAPAEAPAQQTETQQVVAPENLPSDALVQTDAKEATNIIDVGNPLGTFDNPQSDSERLFNETVGSATTAEEFAAAQQEYANMIFDAEGNAIDPSAIIYEEPANTEVTE